jgi:hypothetical protein
LKRSLTSLTNQGIGQLTVLGEDPAQSDAVRPGLLNGFLAKTALDPSSSDN